MATQVGIFGRVRKLLESLDTVDTNREEQLTLTQQLELLVAPGAAAYQEIVRNGRALYVNAVVAVAAVVAIPTTAHMFAIYNNEPDGGRTVIIDWLAAQNVVSTAVVCQAQMIALVGQLRETPPADAGMGFKKCNGMGGGSPDTDIRTMLTGTALPAGTGLAANWMPVGPSVTKPSAVATPGYGMYHEVNGKFFVPPGRFFAMHVLANVVGETFLPWIGYHTKQLTLD